MYDFVLMKSVEMIFFKLSKKNPMQPYFILIR